MNEKIILPEYEESARMVTVSLWESRNGNLYNVDNEKIARWDGATHVKCNECGVPTEKAYTLCQECRKKHRTETYMKIPFEEWDGVTPLIEFDGEEYFFNVDDIESYCCDNNIHPSKLQLIVCEKVEPRYLDIDFFDGQIPDNSLPELDNLIDEFNEKLKTVFPELWEPGEKRTSVKIEIEIENDNIGN
jgi:hypothetical protein